MWMTLDGRQRFTANFYRNLYIFVFTTLFPPSFPGIGSSRPFHFFSLGRLRKPVPQFIAIQYFLWLYDYYTVILFFFLCIISDFCFRRVIILSIRTGRVV